MDSQAVAGVTADVKAGPKARPKRKRQHVFRVETQTPCQITPQLHEHTDLHGPRARYFISDVLTPIPSDVSSTKSPSKKQHSNNTSDFRFTKPKTLVGFTSKLEKTTSSLPKRRKTVTKYARAIPEQPYLTTRKPISRYVPIDFWALVFERCHPSFLINARLVCRDFRDVLNQSHIWRKARLFTYGELIPDCPASLSEFDYANLLAGRGCQISPCTRRDIRKVYWPYMLRMCEKCFSQVGRRAEHDSVESKLYSQLHDQLELEDRQTIPYQLSGLLPAGIMSSGRWSWNRPLNDEQDMWKYRFPPSSFAIKSDDYEALKAEFTAKIVPCPGLFMHWAQTKWSATLERMKIAQYLETCDYGVLEKRVDHYFDKVALYTEKAEQLNPPMRPAVLKRMAAYQSALETANAASLRSWDLLVPKINDPELREQAEQLNQWQDQETIWLDEDGPYDKLAKHRNASKPSSLLWWEDRVYVPEQSIVIQIAQEALDELLDIVHDEDVLLMLLEKTRHNYDAYGSKPDGLNGDGTTGEYRLTLDDARMVVKDVLIPNSNKKSVFRQKKITASLRCIGCTRSDSDRKYTFEQLMIHIRKTHSRYVGKDMHFWKLAAPAQSRFRRYVDPVAWYRLPWPKSFPALPAHRKATTATTWDPDSEQAYTQHKTEEQSRLFGCLKASNNTGIAADDFTGNFCEAIHAFTETRLDSAGIVRIALEYATRRQLDGCSGGNGLELSIQQLKALEAATQHKASNFTFKFKCGICLKDPTCSIRTRHTTYPQAFATLLDHWQKKHGLQKDALVENLVGLPSDYEVQQMIMTEDSKLEMQKKRAGTKVQKGAHEGEEGFAVKDPRLAALLAIPSIQNQFDILFVDSQPRAFRSEAMSSAPHVELKHQRTLGRGDINMDMRQSAAQFVGWL